MEQPPSLGAGDTLTAAAPEPGTKASILDGEGDKSERAASVPISGDNAEAQEATAATSSESAPPPSSVEEAEEDGAEGPAEAALDDTATEAAVEVSFYGGHIFFLRDYSNLGVFDPSVRRPK